MFCKLWRTLLAHITVMKPMTDLCLVCQQNSTAIMRAANMDELEKSEVCLNNNHSIPFTCLYQVVKRAEKHLTLATEARSYMRSQVKKCKEELKRVFPDEVPPIGSAPPACGREMTVHFSFDFAQQVCHISLHNS